MYIRFYGNAFIEIETKSGYRIVCDPWISEGAYYGSWMHFPPFIVDDSFYKNVDYIFISHLHPDHCDARSLRKFDKHTQIIISERKNKALYSTLKGLGFINVIELSTGREHRLNDFRVRLWNDFRGGDVARHDKIEFELDSALAVLDGERVILNLNDNIIEAESAGEISREYPLIDCALIPYAGGGAFPQLFGNLTHEEKLNARALVQERFLSNFVNVANALRARLTVPCAGEYVIGGKNWLYTQYIHTPTPDEIRIFWQASKKKNSELVIMSKFDRLDISSGAVEVSGQSQMDYTHEDRVAYAKSRSQVSYIIDEIKFPAELRLPPAKLLTLLNKARQSLAAAQKRYRCFPNVHIVLEIEGYPFFVLNLASDDSFLCFSELPGGAFIKATLSYDYLLALLTQHVHWNNLEIGNHVKLFRFPEKYEPDAHLLLSFLHV